MKKRISKPQEPVRILGDIFSVEFSENQKRPKGKPVCRVNGKIAFISNAYRGAFVNPMSVWLVEVLDIKQNIVIVEPIEELETAYKHQQDVNKMIKQLATQHAPKHKKVKVHYPYKSAQQRKQ